VSLELHLRLAGALQIALAALHLAFPSHLRWKEELPRLSLLNRQIFVVHTIFICFVLVLMGALSLLAPDALLEPTRLSRLVLGGFAAFWALRLVFQWCLYDRQLWRGNTKNTVIHFVFTIAWTYFASVYAAVLLLGR
jgi:hypothetical protein